MIAIDALRMAWYSRSVSVWLGATVIESPVCTPIGSRFSIEHTITTLSLVSRMTSISNSFQPCRYSSTSTSEFIDRDKPRAAISSNSSTLKAMPPPEPPIVKPGRITHGRPISASDRRASSSVWATRERAVARPQLFIAARNRSRSSALRMTSALAPIISTLYSSSTPVSYSSSATFSAVWPPRVGRTAVGRSFLMILATASAVTGSMYVASAVAGSVMIVAGLEFTKMMR